MEYLTKSPSLEGDEEMIASVKAGPTKLEPGLNPFKNRAMCANCRGSTQSKRLPIHCYVDQNGDIHMTCNKTAICKCRCRTHYIGRDGDLRPYSQRDDSFTKPGKKTKKLDWTKTNKILDDLAAMRQEKADARQAIVDKLRKGGEKK